jgi:NTE family protein
MHLTRRFTLHLILFLCLIVPIHGWTQTKLTLRPHLVSRASEHRNHIYPFVEERRPRVGLVLSGGGARGAAQIGVLKVLEQHKIPIDFIAATSMGAIVGGLYASGYTTAEIESLALTTNWDELLSFSDEAKRTDLAIDQKLAADWSFLVVRFEGLQPVIPHAVSSGQRLTNFLSEQTLQALYHPDPTFDDLKIPFRAVTTDLVSGKRIVLDRGSLAQALRASATVPLLFNPIEQDSMRLVDGGLVSNIPVDVARDAGCDIVLAVNSTSGLRTADEMTAPWQTADQIMGIMMQLSNQEQLKLADITITPEIGRHLSSDFTGLDTLIELGVVSTEKQVDSIMTLYRRALERLEGADTSITEQTFNDVHVEFVGGDPADTILLQIKNEAFAGRLTTQQIRKHMRWLIAGGRVKDVWVDVFPDERPVRVEYHVEYYPVLRSVEFTGNRVLSGEELGEVFRPLIGKTLQHERCDEAVENLLRLYRSRGYSLARIEAARFDDARGVLSLRMNEGVIEKIRVKGGRRTEDSFVLREFALAEGEMFQIDRAKRGLTNINSTKIFEYVYLEITYEEQKPVLTIRISELPSQLIRIGIRADDERKLQGRVDIRDENFRGIGTELGLTLSGGSRNGYATLEFKTNRLFSPIFTFNVGATASVFNSYLYADDPNERRENRWARIRLGEYSEVRYGGRLIVGAHLERLGSFTIEWALQDVSMKNVEDLPQIADHYRLSLFTIGTVVDSRNSFPFPTSGINVAFSYEFATKNFLSDVGYNALRIMYEGYSSLGPRSTLHPRIRFGYGDETMPLAQQFRLGGRESMFGTREDDRRGRQMLAVSLEYRYRLPMRLIFETYLRVRYDLATISEIPEQIKLSAFRHGIGAELALDTPIGQAAFGAGKSFFPARDLPKNPIQQGPLLFYFVLGYEM